MLTRIPRSRSSWRVTSYRRATSVTDAPSRTSKQLSNLFHSIELHQHDGPPTGPGTPANQEPDPTKECQPSTGITLSIMRRNCTGTAHRFGLSAAPFPRPPGRLSASHTPRDQRKCVCGGGGSRTRMPRFALLLVRWCLGWSEPVSGRSRRCLSSPPGSRRTASNACHRVKPVSSKRA